MSYRFTQAALTAILTLTGCAKHQTASEQPDSYFKGPSQINVTHVMTRADDGSDIFLTIDGNDAGPLIAGKNIEVRLPAGKHQVGGYAATMLGLGRVTIPPLEVTTAAGEVTQIAYSVTRDKPVFAKESVTKLPAPAPDTAKPEATPDQNTAVTTQPAATTTDASQSAASTTTQPAATTTDASQNAASTTVQPAATAADASQSAASTTTQPAAATSDASQNAASTTVQPAATSTNASE